jgi:Kef-type K+ transport system membrane component KefB
LSFAQTITLTSLELTRFFIAIVTLLFAAHVFGFLFDRAKLPRVIGEIVGGLLLGPTVLGYFYPIGENWIFNATPSEGKLLSLISWLGLILLMFISGFEIRGTFTREDRKITTSFLLGATILPFIIGFAFTRVFDFTAYAGQNSNMFSLSIIIGIAVAVTSIPVISKIFLDLKIIQTRFSHIVLAIATVEDSILYAGLAIATGLAGALAPSIPTVAYTIIVTGVFFIVGLFIAPRILRRLSESRANIVIESSHSRFALFLCFLFVAVASLVGVNVVFGAFLAGIAIGTMPTHVFAKASLSIRKISLATFTPAYFAIVGLQLDLVHQFDIVMFLSFLLLSSVLKTAGALVVGKAIGKDWLSSTNFAFALNARGGPGIVLATVAFGVGLISEPFFVTLVLAAIVTSLVAGYWLRFVLSRGWTLLNEENSMHEETRETENQRVVAD